MLYLNLIHRASDTHHVVCTVYHVSQCDYMELKCFKPNQAYRMNIQIQVSDFGLSNGPPMEGGSAEAVDEHDGLPGALLDVVYPAATPRPEVVPVRFERQNLQPCTDSRGNQVSL